MSGRYHSYSEYKESGIVWVGKAPDHWHPVRFKHALLEKKKTSNPNLEAGSISFGNVVFKNSDNLSAETKDSYQEVLSGEFLINPLNLNYDLISLRTALSEINVVVSTGYIVLLSNDRLIKKYTRWLLQQFDVAHMKTLGSGVRQTINYSDIGNSFFFEPSQDEQTKIANFLDYETAQIDTLIDKQQQLIKLLKEKRQAVISHAVTKGLNPDAPMKNSGVEWLGEVPEHWVVAKLKYFADMQGGFAFSSDSFLENGVQLLRIGNVYQNRLDLSRQPIFIDHCFKESHKEYVVTHGDILMSLTGTLGKRDYGFAVCVEDKDLFMLNQRLAKISPKSSKITSSYLLYSIWSNTYLDPLYLLPSGTKQANLSNENVLSINVAVPPDKEEQDRISQYVKDKLSRFDGLLNHSEGVINLLSERRTALISAAVTGKIDVRNWQLAG